MYDVGFAEAKRRYICLKNIDKPIVTTKTAMLPKLFFLSGLKRRSSKSPPKTPHKTVLSKTEVIKFIPKGENLSKYKRLESGEDEKKRVMIAPKAIISPCAKFTILVTPYSNESATEPKAIITPSSNPFPSCSIIMNSYLSSKNLTFEPSSTITFILYTVSAWFK